MRRICLLLVFMGSFSYVIAQKPAIDFPAIDHWPVFRMGNSNVLSNDGMYFSYQIENRPVGGSTLVVGTIEGNWHREFINVRTCAFAADNQHFIFLGGGDTLWIVGLGNDSAVRIAHVQSWQLSSQGWLVYETHTERDRLVVYCTMKGRGDELPPFAANWAV